MRRALHILVLIAVFLCGVHPGEPAQAHEDPAHRLLHLALHVTDTGDSTGSLDADKAAHGAHQHCPLAAEDDRAPLSCAAPCTDSPLFARPVAALSSLSRAPPVEPPSA